MKTTIYVSNMSCMHCKMRIEQGLKQLPGISIIDISVPDKTVKIEGEIRESDAIEAIRNIGYSAELKTI
ncbi:MAG: heavy-metal-associated domain-containing protein [Candidatus Marinimicrobia bacterium]|nr:heavy-metal-associated domain-containing protein [Candidatus Neomarinimicrobiota bacterium]